MLDFIEEVDYRLAYQTFGIGQKVLLAFHGFGQDARAFEQIIKAFPEHTVYSFDLFCHHQSIWRGSLDGLGYAEWQAIMQKFLTKHSIEHFDLIGFSMGGRIALITAYLFATQIGQLWLLSPDGIKPNAWYRIATKYAPLQRAFKHLTHDAYQRYAAWLPWLTKYRMVSKSLMKIAQHELSSPEKRVRVYQTWMLFRFLEVDLRQLAQRLNEQKVKVTFVLGKYDRLINTPTVMPLAKRLHDKDLIVLESGHHRLVEAAIRFLTQNKDSRLAFTP